MAAKILGAQRDFSYGEIDVALKRADDHPARKAGLRQMVNARILNSGAIQDRPGRRALFPISNSCSRIEEFTISPRNIFKIAFGAGRWQIIDASGSIVKNVTTQGNGAALPWTVNDLNQIVYTIMGLSVYVTFAGMRPQVITWDGVSTWSFADYNESVSSGGQKRTAFYRISPQGVTMLPSATSGNITVSFSAAIAVAGMQGTRVRYAGRQIVLGSIISNQQMNATVVETLPSSQSVAVTGQVGNFAVGDEVVGGTSGAKGIVIASNTSQSINVASPIFTVGDAVTGGTSGATGVVTAVLSGGVVIVVSLSTGTAFVNSETITGPGGSTSIIGTSTTSLLVQPIPVNGTITYFVVNEKIAGPSASATIQSFSSAPPQAISVWDEEVMNSYRGFPASCFADQFRLGFCNFPSLPNAISWSAINSQNDLYVDGLASSAMLEIAPAKVQVYYVVPGPESSEFVFCDTKIYYIPISASNPLKAGSVAFQTLSADGCSQVQPRVTQGMILYANAGQNSVRAIIATGAYNRPFNTKDLSEFHSHLFSSIRAIAAPNADGTFNERYAYVLNNDGSIAVGKYNLTDFASEAPRIGWGPWAGTGVVSWVAAWNADVLFTATYFGAPICEILDDAQYLDCALSVNALPAAFTPPGGKGPLWFIPSQTVSLIDQVTRSMGVYQVDANGFIVPQFNGGEDLTVSSLVAGQSWNMVVEPFCPDASPGTDVGQRMFRRRVSRFAAYVLHSTGFVMARLFAGPITLTSPALGSALSTRRIPAWNQDDDATKPPPQREEAQRWRPLGRAYDPRVAVIKDTPGPLLISEIGMEATV